MNKYRQFSALGTGSVLLLSAFLNSGCVSDGSNTEQGAIGGAVAGAIIGGIIGHQSGETEKGMAAGAASGAIIGGVAGNRQDRRLSEIQYERRVAEEALAKERAQEDARRQRLVSQGKSTEDSEILAARQRAEAAEAEVARLRAEEEAALRKAKQLEEYRAREAAARAEADRIRNGQ